jgi:hypothetical protein
MIRISENEVELDRDEERAYDVFHDALDQGASIVGGMRAALASHPALSLEFLAWLGGDR